MRKHLVAFVCCVSVLFAGSCAHQAKREPSAPLTSTAASDSASIENRPINKGSSAAVTRPTGKDMEPVAKSGRDRLEGRLKTAEDSCRNKNAGACNLLARALEQKATSKTDFERAAHFYEEGCSLGSAAACSNFGVLVYSGNLGPEDAERSAALYKQACELGFALGCGNYAGRLKWGNGVDVDIPLAVEFGKRGCSGGSAYSCRMLGLVYRVAKRPQEAASAFQLACEQGEGMGCAELGDLYLVLKSPEKAEAAHARGIQILGPDCFDRRRVISCQIYADTMRAVFHDEVEAKRAIAVACSRSPRHCEADANKVGSHPASVDNAGTAQHRGSLSRSAIQQTIRKNFSRIKYCYEKELRLHPEIAGKIFAHFKIGPDGTVVESEVSGPEAFNAVSQCTNAIVLEMVFPAPKGGGIVNVHYPFVFSATPRP